MPATAPADFNTAHFAASRARGRIRPPYPTLNMKSKIDASFNRIARLSDLSDLAELLFPGNRNHQHAFLAMWLTLKWSDHRIVPNFSSIGRTHGISRRTLERVRAKLRRLGLIDHVSRFNARHGYREGWVLSTRFECSLRRLANTMTGFRDRKSRSEDKDTLLLQFAEARRGYRSEPDSRSYFNGGDQT